MLISLQSHNAVIMQCNNSARSSAVAVIADRTARRTHVVVKKLTLAFSSTRFFCGAFYG